MKRSSSQRKKKISNSRDEEFADLEEREQRGLSRPSPSPTPSPSTSSQSHPPPSHPPPSDGFFISQESSIVKLSARAEGSVHSYDRVTRKFAQSAHFTIGRLSFAFSFSPLLLVLLFPISLSLFLSLCPSSSFSFICLFSFLVFPDFLHLIIFTCRSVARAARG